ncbi:Phosphotransferase [Trichostrongylus colubriformis]|uniref:Phosphotransferase n=1 Tax=Trichostrongylus colubriformis TaxID=6319 RepID=A0AAN8ITZ1_TRICO
MDRRKKPQNEGILSGMFGSISSLFGADDAAGRRSKIENICKCFVLTNETLEQVMTLLETSIDRGLNDDSGAAGALKMLPTYVRAVPNGEESGDFLALDLGGTNFRILLIRLSGREAEMTGKVYSVPDSIMQGAGEELFDHIAACMARFMEEQGIPFTRKLALGFTFSFPCKQEGLTSAKLIRWTKGFNLTGCEGQDVCKMLKEACGRRSDIDIDVVALLNDTVGTLMACAFKENTCQIGVIIGTGTNACYMEQLDRIPKLKAKLADDGLPDEIVMNTEWGAFGDDGALSFINTKYDREVDKSSINPGKQIFEKMISGMYLGEIVRMVVKELAQQGLLFGGETAPLARRGTFSTRFMSDIESDISGEEAKPTYQNTAKILSEIGFRKATQADCANVAYVCSVVTARAAHLLAAGIATLINRMSRPLVTVGIDGSVYRFHPRFPQLLDDKIAELIDENLRYKLMLSEDGSGIGAAIVAAVATRIAAQKEEEPQQESPNDNE